MSDALDAFLKEGFSTYAEAKAVVKTFEEEVQGRLKGALASRRDWGILKERKIKDARPGGEANYGWWIPVYMVGSTTTGHAVDIDAGVWWQAPNAAHDPIVYASFDTKPKSLLTFDFEPTDGRITSLSQFGGTILQSPLPANLDLASALNSELDILLGLLRSLKRAER